MGIFNFQTRTRKTLQPKELPWTTAPVWSPQGDKIAFAKLNEAGFNEQGFIGFRKGTVYTANPDGTGLRQVSDELSAYNPTWSPQGNHVIYNARLGSLQLYITDLNGGNPTQLTDEGDNLNPDWFDPSSLGVSPTEHSLTTTWGEIKAN